MQFCNDKNYTFLPCTTCGAYHLLLLLALFLQAHVQNSPRKIPGLAEAGFLLDFLTLNQQS